ncbi:hypothetical protein JHD46_01060 [Sulfurimonas sp. SAG-AH-194-C20]|nr:hypothetical protein [Sulfurimonas sp. SAG-AH-194-C20]MDF1878221.1 hypothetical protein [Sulfurimonas sp. SAG-AH-194-C20]
MEYFLKYQQVILRTLGVLLLLIGFVVHFWTVPQKGVSKNDRAVANLARMEASIQSSTSTKKSKSKPDSSKFLKELKGQQKKQMEYLTILLMLLGIGSLGYSFFKKKEEIK